VEVSLLDLAAAYASLVGGGLYRVPAVVPGEPRPQERRVFSSDTAHLLCDVLSDPSARVLTFGNVRSFDFPFVVAVKTGTSTAYRDCWAVGCTSVYTVAVWAGNFTGSPTGGLSGATAAAPILRGLLLALHRNRPPARFERPAGLISREVCSDSGLLPGPECATRTTELFLARLPAPDRCSMHRSADPGGAYLGPDYAGWLADREMRGVRGRYHLDPRSATGAGIEIAYPHADDRFVLPRATGEESSITVRAIPRQAVPFLRWFLDGVEVSRTPPPYRWSWKLTRGRHTLLATGPDLTGSTAVRVHVE
jgi:penicillin-binding protein 1C